MRDVLAARIDNDEPSAVWMSRAHTCAEPIAPVLCWAHDVKGLEPTSDPVAVFSRFDNLVRIAGGEPVRVGIGAHFSDWAELSDPLRSRVRRYLAGLPGFVPGATIRGESAARVIHAHARYVLCLSF
jgi:hypothetical protein